MAWSISRQDMTEIPKHKHHVLIRKISMKAAPKIALKDSPIWMLLLIFAHSIRANNFSMI